MLPDLLGEKASDGSRCLYMSESVLINRFIFSAIPFKIV